MELDIIPQLDGQVLKFKHWLVEQRMDRLLLVKLSLWTKLVLQTELLLQT